MTSAGAGEAPVGGILRLTRVTDSLAHVLEHAGTDEPAGTWTGHACPDHGLAIGSDVDTTVLLQLCAAGRVADLIWEPPDQIADQHRRTFAAAMQAHQAGDLRLAHQHWDDLMATWSQAWTANCAALDLLQHSGIAAFAPAKPQRWIIASFEHHCGPHGAPSPHVHNIVAVTLTIAASSTRSKGIFDA
jgi:hypothetical protein